MSDEPEVTAPKKRVGVANCGSCRWWVKMSDTLDTGICRRLATPWLPRDFIRQEVGVTAHAVLETERSAACGQWEA